MGMTPRNLLVLMLLVFSTSLGCAKAGDRAAPPTSVAEPTALAKAGPTSARDLAVTVHLSLTVDHVQDSVDQLRAEVEREGGYVSHADVAGDTDDASADLEVHVPKSELGSLRPLVAKMGDVTSDVESTEDVTEARADVKARLHAAQVEEARLLELMQDHTGKLSEVLESEKELARVRETIERIQAEERTMDGRVAFATVHVHLRSREIAAWRTPGTSLGKAGRAGVHAAASIAVGLGMALAATSPTLVPVALLIAGIVVLVRRRRRAQNVIFDRTT